MWELGGWVRPFPGDQSDSNYSSGNRHTLNFRGSSPLSNLRHLHRPCARLWKSLYGHPESGGHWAHRFAAVIATLGGVESKIFPRNLLIPKSGLLVTLYVDDVLVSGPQENHVKFWKELGKHLKFEEPQQVNRVLGRNHIIRGDVVEFEMGDFTQECCNRYLQITAKKKGFQESSDALSWGIYLASWRLWRPRCFASLRCENNHEGLLVSSSEPSRCPSCFERVVEEDHEMEQEWWQETS